MIKYGLISETDGKTIEKTLKLICEGFSSDEHWPLNILEVGVYAGETGSGIRDWFYWESKGRRCYLTGIDNIRDDEPLRYEYDKLIIGNSNEVYNQIEDESQHFCFIDGLHTFAGVISDFFCYAPKVKLGGYIAFHDTGEHLNPLSGWQGVGNKNDPDMCLGGVRKALKEIGLLDEFLDGTPKFELIFDEADVNDTGGGICVFKKLY